MSSKTLEPGNKAPISGQYMQFDANKRPVKEITSTKSHPLPPGPSGATYRPVDPTKNKSGR